MKEFSFDVELWKGLRNYDNQRRGAGYLTECINTIPMGEERGLAPVEEVSCPLSSITVNWPFPQLFRGKGVTLLADKTKIYTVDESDWGKTQITTYDAFSIAAEKSITAGSSWHFMDFYDTWMLFNGSCVVFHTERYNVFGGTDRTFVQDTVTVQTGCDFRGRGLMGGFAVADFLTDDWTAFWDNWLINKPTGSTFSHTIDTNFVLWTTIGGGDLLWLFYKDIAESGFTSDGFHDAVRPLVLEQMKRNQRGFMPMPWQGTVYRLVPLGKRVIVYGSGGVSSLMMVSEPVPTFGLEDVLHVGVAGRSAVAAGPYGHIFVDTTGMLWLLNADLSLKQLGYKEFFEDMLSTDIVGSYSPIDNRYYLCNEGRGFIWNPEGLCETSQLITSLARVGANHYGVFEKTGDSTMAITSDVFNMNIPGIKLVSQVDVEGTAGTDVEVAIDWRYKTGDKFVRTRWQRVNDFGVAFITVSGAEFRLAVRANPSNENKYDNARVHWKSSDKRFVRGLITKT